MERTLAAPGDVRLNAADRRIHLAQSADRLVRLLAVNAEVSAPTTMCLDDFLLWTDMPPSRSRDRTRGLFYGSIISTSSSHRIPPTLPSRARRRRLRRDVQDQPSGGWRWSLRNSRVQLRRRSKRWMTRLRRLTTNGPSRYITRCASGIPLTDLQWSTRREVGLVEKNDCRLARHLARIDEHLERRAAVFSTDDLLDAAVAALSSRRWLHR